MKTTGTILLAILLSLGFAVTSFAAIAGTAHDLSYLANDQICVYCHTPHNADSTVEPLWNADLSTATFTAYTSSTFDGSATMDADPVIGPSRLCMSCHDGTVAIDSAIGGTTSIGTGGALLGVDLTNDHPIGFNYNAAQGLDAEIQPSTAVLGSGVISDFLFGANNIMTCASCHDVHGVTGVGQFLLEDNAGSALCLRCHIK